MDAMKHGVVYSAPKDGEQRHQDTPHPTWQEQVRGYDKTQKNEFNAYVPVAGPDLNNLAGVKPFADHYERAQAFRDPRYQSSEAYRNEVAQRAFVTKL
jgi:hypothetical protein